MTLRPVYLALLLLALLVLAAAALHADVAARRREAQAAEGGLRPLTAFLGLADLAVSSEARYTRHPALSDMAVVGMDHPGAIDHFPSTLFFAPPAAP